MPLSRKEEKKKERIRLPILLLAQNIPAFRTSQCISLNFQHNNCEAIQAVKVGKKEKEKKKCTSRDRSELVGGGVLGLMNNIENARGFMVSRRARCEQSCDRIIAGLRRKE